MAQSNHFDHDWLELLRQLMEGSHEMYKHLEIAHLDILDLGYADVLIGDLLHRSRQCIERRLDSVRPAVEYKSKLDQTPDRFCSSTYPVLKPPIVDRVQLAVGQHERDAIVARFIGFHSPSIQNRHNEHKRGLDRRISYGQIKKQHKWHIVAGQMKGVNMTIDEALQRPTLPVPVAGKVFFDMERGASYAAAKKGDIPTIEVGGRKFAVVSAIAQQLGLQTQFGQAAEHSSSRVNRLARTQVAA